MNKVILIGRLTKDTELTTTTSGVSIAKNTLAVNRKFKNADGNYETDFINIVAWRNLADLLHRYRKKGDRVGIVGSIQTRSYDAPDGSKRYVTEVIAEEVEFLSEKLQVESEAESQETKPCAKLIPIENDDLPF
jgi:single-strand DNA-binding protein